MKFKNKNERRQFLKRASATGIGLGVAVTGLAKTDPVFARLGNKMTEDHVNQVIAQIKQASPNESAPLAFTQTVDNIRQLVDRDQDPDAMKANNVIKNMIYELNLDEFGIDEDGILGIPQRLSDVLVGAYLAAITDFNYGEFETNELRRYFHEIKPLEPGFLVGFSEQIQHLKNNDPSIMQKFEEIGQPQLSSAINKVIVDHQPANKLDPITIISTIFTIACIITAVVFAVVKKKKK